MFGAMQSDIMSRLSLAVHFMPFLELPSGKCLCECKLHLKWRKEEKKFIIVSCGKYSSGMDVVAYANWNSQYSFAMNVNGIANERHWKREMVSCNFFDSSMSYHVRRRVHVHTATHIHITQYAMHCNLVILHGRLFPINATHTEHFFLSGFFTLCYALHDKVSIACFHQPRHSKGYDFFLLVVVFVTFFLVAFPNVFTSICCLYKQIKKNINKSKYSYSYSYLPFRSVPLLWYIIHFQWLGPKRLNLCVHISIYLHLLEKERKSNSISK